jgi:hypothetical protein
MRLFPRSEAKIEMPSSMTVPRGDCENAERAMADLGCLFKIGGTIRGA